MKEQTIQSKIIKYLEGEGSYVVKVVSANRAGIPDVLACVPMTLDQIKELMGENSTIGVFVGVEVKNETGVATKLQIYNVQKINLAGGIAGVCRSVDDVKQLIEQVK